MKTYFMLESGEPVETVVGTFRPREPYEEIGWPVDQAKKFRDANFPGCQIAILVTE